MHGKALLKLESAEIAKTSRGFSSGLQRGGSS